MEDLLSTILVIVYKYEANKFYCEFFSLSLWYDVVVQICLILLIPTNIYYYILQTLITD